MQDILFSVFLRFSAMVGCSVHKYHYYTVNKTLNLDKVLKIELLSYNNIWQAHLKVQIKHGLRVRLTRNDFQ